MNYSWFETEVVVARLKNEIEEVYKEAAEDLQDKFEEFNRKYKIKESIHLQDVKDGKWTQEKYDKWVQGQIFQSDQWKAKRDDAIKTLYEANTVATRLINGERLNIFAMSANYEAYQLEHGAGVDFGFRLYNADSVARLIQEEPQMLPEWKINESKDYIWNYKKVNNAVRQGIIQGEKLDQITKRMAKGLCAQNMNTMKTFAQTAMTGAQGAGTLERLKEAEKLGIKVHKEWMATLDERTRTTHQELDGQKQPLNKPFKVEGREIRFPGDPQAHPSMVYNCRCTLVGDLDDYPEEYERRDNIEGKPIKNMTYKQWYNAKKGITEVDSFQTRLGRARSVTEINGLMNSQGWWRKLSGYDLQADLTGVDLDSAKSIAASYEQVFEKYPQLKGKFDPPDAHPHNMGDNTYAWCYTRTNGKVQVNPIESKYGNWNNIMKAYEQDVLSNWHPQGTTAESIVIHEIGHAIDGLLAREDILGGITSSGEYRYASSSLKNTIMKRVAKTDDDLAHWLEQDRLYKTSYATELYVSGYAAENNREWFAECFAEYITSANPRLVASEFGKELEKLIGRLK